MPRLLAFHLGAFEVACQAGTPIVPVVVRGTHFILRSDQWLPRRGVISVHVGEPIAPTGHDFPAAIRLRDAARAQILARLGEPDLVHERAVFSYSGDSGPALLAALSVSLADITCRVMVLSAVGRHRRMMGSEASASPCCIRGQSAP